MEKTITWLVFNSCGADRENRQVKTPACQSVHYRFFAYSLLPSFP
ncbi:hypothetical protein CLOM621_08803 [Clostridium sp. M62/1]|nr:hypothetical protein CLOM621_08803 [Clostridium sp. M62/1]